MNRRNERAKEERIKDNIEDATQVKLTLKPTELFSLKKIQFVLEREFEIKNFRRRNRKEMYKLYDNDVI